VRFAADRPLDASPSAPVSNRAASRTGVFAAAARKVSAAKPKVKQQNEKKAAAEEQQEQAETLDAAPAESARDPGVGKEQVGLEEESAGHD
jgi:hypothetical protein